MNVTFNYTSLERHKQQNNGMKIKMQSVIAIKLVLFEMFFFTKYIDSATTLVKSSATTTITGVTVVKSRTSTFRNSDESSKDVNFLSASSSSSTTVGRSTTISTTESSANTTTSAGTPESTATTTTASGTSESTVITITAATTEPISVIYVMDDVSDPLLKLPISEIKDETVRKVVEQFQTLCPHTPLCKTRPVNRTIMDSTTNTCCRICECEGCGTECCPDQPERYLHKAEQSENFLEFVRTQYKPLDNTRENGILISMVTRCPIAYENKYIKQRCEQDILDFDFKEGLYGFMPVTASVSLRTFKNVYCTNCHGEAGLDLLYWGVKLGCVSDTVLEISSEADIKGTLDKRSDCNIIFEKPALVSKHLVTCEPRIEMCNVTGKWDHYDSALVTACLSYTSVYQRSSDTTPYKNVHCYLCNSEKESKLIGNCTGRAGEITVKVRSSFIALLDFNNLEKAVTSAGLISCPRNSKYDTNRKTCRPLLCSRGMKLSGHKCVPIFQSLTTSRPIGFDITLLVQEAEEKSATQLSSNQLRDTILSEAINELGLISSAKVMLCNAKSFIKLNKSIHSIINKHNSSFTYSNIGQFGMQFHLTVSRIKNMSKTIEELEGVFIGDKLNLGKSRRVTIVNVEKSQMVRHIPAKTSENLAAIGLPGWFRSRLSSLEFDEYIEGTLPFISQRPNKRCSSFNNLQLKPFCPKVKVTLDEFNVTDDKVNIYLTYLDEFVNGSDVMYNILGKSAFICAGLYFELVEKSRVRHGTYSNTEESVFTPLTILTMICISLSLVSLLITFVVYSILPKLRTIPGKNNMALVVWLFLSQFFTLLNMAVVIKIQWVCSAIGLLLHFSLLSSFTWMFMCTFHMLKVFIAIERSSQASTGKIFLRYVVVTACVSVAVVVITITESYLTSDPHSIAYGGQFCYVRDPLMILYTVAIPVAVVVIADIFMFVYVILKISKLPDMRRNCTSERNNITIFAKISTITGLTWIFGFVYQFSNLTVFAYIFVIFNASQGVFIMFSFVCNKRVLDMFRKKE